MTLLPQRDPTTWRRERATPVDARTLEQAAAIVEDVRARGQVAVVEHALRLGDLQPSAAIVIERAQLERAAAELPAGQLALLERTAKRIRTFALAQRACLRPLELEGAGHVVAPVERVGCYAPGGRYPLPSSVLMTAVTARAAGVDEVWVASPRPAPITLAAAAVAGADGLLAIGGAQAIAALAFGTYAPPVDFICGPGNRWVTAAKKHLFGEVGIDMLAGPSELVVIADGSADADTIAADLLAQAEHDPDALPVLITTEASLMERVERALSRQLETLPSAEVARAALSNGGALLVSDLNQAATLCNRLAPEHLQLAIEDPESFTRQVRHYGALFLGDGAEVLGDYGAGPNHVLPTGRGARFTGGLSVLSFLRTRTWLSAAAGVAADAVDLARCEGLEAHARAARERATD